MTVEPRPPAPLPQPQRQPLASEQVILASPLSFAGATQRRWRFWQPLAVEAQGWRKGGLWTLLWLMLVLAWAAVLAWYCLLAAFGVIPLLILISVRIARRNGRKAEVARLRHAELMTALGDRKAQP